MDCPYSDSGLFWLQYFGNKAWQEYISSTPIHPLSTYFDIYPNIFTIGAGPYWPSILNQDGVQINHEADHDTWQVSAGLLAFDPLSIFHRQRTSSQASLISQASKTHQSQSIGHLPTCSIMIAQCRSAHFWSPFILPINSSFLMNYFFVSIPCHDCIIRLNYI